MRIMLFAEDGMTDNVVGDCLGQNVYILVSIHLL